MKDERNEPQNTGGNVFSFPFRTRSDGVTYPDLDDGKRGNPIVSKGDR
jgi:hypothetical protein